LNGVLRKLCKARVQRFSLRDASDRCPKWQWRFGTPKHRALPAVADVAMRARIGLAHLALVVRSAP